MKLGRFFGQYGEVCTKAMLAAAAAALLLSMLFPFWKLTVKAPQYPKGLKVQIYLNRVTGDVQEIDSLNHYIGMRPLNQAGRIERKLSTVGVPAMAAALILAMFVRRRIGLLLILPAVIFPAIFAADLYYWLRDFGLHLNPRAPLSSSVKPFIPPLLGHGKIAQFNAIANFALGHGLSMLSALLGLACIFLRSAGAKKKPNGVTILVLALMFLPSPAAAREIQVGAGSHPTIGSALQDAADGDIILVSPGVYREHLEIRKSVTLQGQGYPAIDGENQGTVLRLDAPGIVLRGFLIKNSGDGLAAEDSGIRVGAKNALIEDNRLENVLFGISLNAASGSVLRNNRLAGKPLDLARRGDLIRVWYSHDCVVEGNEARTGRDAVLWFSKRLKVLGNRIEEARYGLHFMYCEKAVVENNELSRNSVGAYLMYSQDLTLRQNRIFENRGPSGYGIGFKDMQGALIQDNAVANNRVGLFFDGTTAGKIENNLIAYNDIGAQLLSTSRKNDLSGNNFVENAEQAVIEGPSLQGTNSWSANYWSDYRGFDADGDKTGDVPYAPMRGFERLTDRRHELKIFSGSPAVQALDFAAETFPVFAASPKLSDARPKMELSEFRSGTALRPQNTAPAWSILSLILFLPALGALKI